MSTQPDLGLSIECEIGQCDDCRDQACTCHCHLPDDDDDRTWP